MTTSDDRRAAHDFLIVADTQPDVLAVIRDAQSRGLNVFVVGDFNESIDAERAMVGGLGFAPLLDPALPMFESFHGPGLGTIDGFAGRRVVILDPQTGPEVSLKPVFGDEAAHDHFPVRIEVEPSGAAETAARLCRTSGLVGCRLIEALGPGKPEGK